MILREHYEQYYLVGFSIIVLLVLIFVYWKLPLHTDESLWDNKWGFLVIPISALITYILNVELGLGPVFAVGIVGVMGTYIHKINSKSRYLIQIAAPIYCGAFIGMSTINDPYIYCIIILASLFTSFLFYSTKSLFVGVGGKLGTLAFIGVVLSMLVFKVILKYIWLN